MTMRALAILGLLILAGCHGGGNGSGSDGWAGGGSSIVSMDAATWDFRYGSGISGHPTPVATGGFAFDFPASGDVDYLTTNVSIAAESKVHAAVRIDGAGTFTATDGCSPAAFGIMLEARNDDLRSEDGRWWARLQRPPVGNGDYVLDVPITDLSQWSNVLGHVASDRPDAFHAAMGSLGAVGVTFGACSFGHGVSVSGGTAKMTVTEFTVQ